MLTISPRSNFSAPAEAADDAAESDADDADVRALLGSSLDALERRGRFRCDSSAALGVSSPAGIAPSDDGDDESLAGFAAIFDNDDDDEPADNDDGDGSLND